MPRCFRSSRVRLILVTRTTGRCSSAPAAALATTSVMPAARRSGMMMAPAPAAWAVRMTAPRLCGSSTPSSTTSISADATESSSAYWRGAPPRGTTPWWPELVATRSSAERGSKRTGTPARRARSTISCKRGPPAPWAMTMRSMGLAARKASATGWMPLSKGMALGLGQNFQSVVEAVGEVRHGDHEGDFHHLFVGKMLEHFLARRLRVGGAGQFARIANGGALARADALVPPVLERAQFVFGESRFAPTGEVGGDAECALVGVGRGQVQQHFGAAIHRARTQQRSVERDEILQRVGAVGHGAEERVRLFGPAFEGGEEFVGGGIDFVNRGCHRH